MERVEIYGHYRQADRQAVRRARQVPARARQRLRPRTPSAPHTPSHPSTPGTCTPSTPPVPSRAAKTGGTPRAAKTGLLVARTPTQRPRTPSSPVRRRHAAATPSQPSTPGRTTFACQPRITVRSRRAGFNGNISGTRNQALVAPPVPSRAAKTGGTPPTPRPRTPSAAPPRPYSRLQRQPAQSKDDAES